MMNHRDTIVNEYVSTDETGRLFLFLSHRELRDSFIKIDMAESSREREKQVDRPAMGWADRVLRFCPGCSKS